MYFMTFYAPPMFSWWGKGFLESIGQRWVLAASIILVIGVLLDKRPMPRIANRHVKLVFYLLLIYCFNATLVHYLLADTPERSIVTMIRSWKHVGLFLVLCTAIRDKWDFKLMLYCLMLGGLFVGVEVCFRDAGRIFKGRLEGVALGSAGDANFLSQIMSLSIIPAGYFVVCGRWRERLVALATCGLLVEVIQKSGSRAMFVSVFVGAAALLVRARGRARMWAAGGLVLSVCALFLVAGDYEQEFLIKRLESIFVSTEDRDRSAASRLEMHEPALKMIADYPLGSGGEAAFKSRRGLRYIPHIFDHYMAVHNGYLDIAASWGIQGLLLILAAVFLSWQALARAMKSAYRGGDFSEGFQACCLEAMLVVLVVSTLFISSLRGEWFIWWMVLALKQQDLREDAEAAGNTESSDHLQDEDEYPEDGSDDDCPQQTEGAEPVTVS